MLFEMEELAFATCFGSANNFVSTKAKKHEIETVAYISKPATRPKALRPRGRYLPIQPSSAERLIILVLPT